MFVSIVIFILVLSVLILVHEFGHFTVAKCAGIRVEEFGFGLPPRLFGKKIGETLYSLNALPFGGFVRLYGEQDEKDVKDISRSFLHKSKKVRAFVAIAGVVMNILLALVSFAVVYSFSGIPRDTHKLKVVDVSVSSPAETAGIVVGDIITKVGDNQITSTDDFIAKTGDQKGKSMVLTIDRTTSGNTSTLNVKITPRENPPAGQGPLGVTITTMELFYPPVWQRPFYGIYYGGRDALYWGKTIVGGLWGIIAGAIHGQSPQGVSGPIGIFAVTTEAAKSGILTLINFVGILSLNLAVLNIIPFPALDGGRLLFIGIESVIGKKIPSKVEATINNVGFLILLLLLVIISVGDVKRLITFKGITGFINSMGK